MEVPARRIIGTGEMADRVRAYDWQSTPLGPIDSWSKELVTIVNLTLASSAPARTMWGPELILIYNDAYRPIPGPRHPAALGKVAREVYSESWQVVGPLLEQAFATGKTVFYEKLLIPLPTATGLRDAYLNYSFSPIFEEGSIAGLFGSIHDVTGEVIALRKLAELEARASRILQSIGDAVIVTDEHARITNMNQVAENLTGWTLDDARGEILSTVFHIVDEEVRQPFESPADKVRRLGTIVGLANHTLLIRRDGTELPIDDSGAPIWDESGNLTGIVLVFRDITERKQASKAMQRLAAIVDSSDDVIVSTTLDGTITSWNAAATRLFEYTPEEMNGQSILKLIPAHLQAEEKRILESIRAGQRVEHFDTLRLTKSGAPIEVSLSVSPIRDERGQVIGASKILRDVADRKRIERSLLQTEKIAATGRMAATIAHEINNPLEAVMNLLYLLRSKIPDQEGQTYLATAEGELERVAHIAKQTLGYYREHTAAAAAALSEIAQQAVTIYEPRCAAAGIHVRTSFESTAKPVLRRGEMMQVISNLIANSIYAMPAGGHLTITVQDTEELVPGTTLTVADDGVGIEAANMPKVFEAFFTTRSTVGTGIGLFVAKQFIEGHGGHIRIASQTDGPNHGTTVRIFVPLKTPYAEPKAP